MGETRQIMVHARHEGQGPHLAVPSGFTPLRLSVLGQELQLDVTSPLATVGRHSSADLRLGFPEVSRQHCQFVFEAGAWRVYDLHSLNGIFVNNVPTTDATLFAGDYVRIGTITLLVMAATPVRGGKHATLRQIVDSLPDAH